ncbi:hypothetical protein AK812_SmicGene30205 [Symbiodinium microadriaticum]|uniref:Armadillo repeat-containing protein 6 n=1 Tax=Symbiodinium microadriaticum TaxID=2951 RepID=A0A1Q9CZX5_SYMMI|nr:hypothetical protein AK812_SmicGene30205 [Symbiodinium microadriaticum]
MSRSMSGLLDEVGSRKDEVETSLQKLRDLALGEGEGREADAEADKEEALGAVLEGLEAATLRSSTCQRRFLQLDGPQLLLTGMAAHLENMKIQLISCRILQHLASLVSLDAAEVLADFGACEAIQKALEAHPNVAALHQAALQALELLAFTGTEARLKALRCGCPEVVVASLKRFRTDAHVQQACLAALQALLEDSAVGTSTDSEEESNCQEIVAKLGGIAAIVGALADHREDAQLQYWGQVVLSALCHDNVKLRAEAQQKCHWQRIEVDFDI